ncbi:hypothetical protein BD626DRAFT_480003 [Schizophyllum amplum]|uniref:Uncharacterized protein n=1 Tax=Schizophyllum amplum TaxID=97359 RepID=A0A550CST8_9AGAR|nr:hypothetical protein BD626DRAFT_480002 [Auriculariopsis ampla]TRM67849.1 hypothetical protein BD626DRAFT_480003 [Auriculariopsis ampla]
MMHLCSLDINGNFGNGTARRQTPPPTFSPRSQRAIYGKRYDCRTVLSQLMSAEYHSVRHIYGTLRRCTAHVQQAYGRVRRLYGAIRHLYGTYTALYGASTALYGSTLPSYGYPTAVYGEARQCIVLIDLEFQAEVQALFIARVRPTLCSDIFCSLNKKRTQQRIEFEASLPRLEHL